MGFVTDSWLDQGRVSRIIREVVLESGRDDLVRPLKIGWSWVALDSRIEYCVYECLGSLNNFLEHVAGVRLNITCLDKNSLSPLRHTHLQPHCEILS